MAAATNSSSKLNAAQRAAAVVIALGADNASEVYKYLRDEEVEVLSLEIAKMERLPPEEMKAITDDFYGLCVTQKVISEGGVNYARDILEKAYGPQQAMSLMERVSKSLRTKSFDFLRKVDYKNLLMILQNEHPQTIAMVLSYCRAEQASQIIAELPESLQVDVIERIAKLDRASPEIVNLVEKTLERRFANIVSVEFMEMGGVTYVADIMNNVDRSTEKFIFDELGNKDPQLEEEIRKLMFVFEDIVTLDNLAIQRFIRETDSKDLAVALKSTSDEVKQTIFSNMSQRMRENIEGDMQYLHNIRLSDVEEAQQKIVGIIRQLQESGDIIISKGGKDEIIA
jgi:flagellar motor switch protein FliG